MDNSKLIAGLKAALDAVQAFAPEAEGIAAFVPGASAALKIAEAAASVGEGILTAVAAGQAVLAAQDVATVNTLLAALQAESDRIHAAIQAG